MGGMNAPHYGPLQAELNGPGIVAPAFFLPLCTEVLRRRILGSSPPALCIATDLHRAVFLEVPSIGWQLFILESYQSDSTAFPSCLDTYATRLLTEPLSRQIGGDDAITTRMGAVALPIGVVLIAISEIFHPASEDPIDFPAVFEEYAQSNVWTTVHLGEYCGFLLLLGGLVALYYSVSARPGAGAGLAPFGFAAAVTTAASFTVLQAVD